MTRRLTLTLRAAALTGVLAAGSALTAATPASAHAGHFGCGTYWQTSPQNIKRTCSSGTPGANFRVYTFCVKISPGTGYWAYGNWTINATSTVWCGSFYEPDYGRTQFTHN
ncbi:MAG TPA: hypothetical protein VFM54_08290 [Micromonosporaceae bacterium]|nr:hypothetical protein [Micromonosporaceae bacterium]